GVVHHHRVEDNKVSLDRPDVATGKSNLVGRTQVTTGKPRPQLKFNFTAPALALADLPLAAGAHAAPAKAAPKSRYVFTEEPLGFAGLKGVDATGEVALDTLVLRDGQRLEHVHAQLGLQNGVLDVPVVTHRALRRTL